MTEYAARSLADLAARIRAEHEAAAIAIKRGLEHAITAGNLLIGAKKQLAHGQWLPWLRDQCQVPERTAQLYMRLARHLENRNVADFTVREAIALLHASSHDGSRVQSFTGEVERYTPPWVIELVRSFYGGEIGLDPASCPAAQKNVRANRYFTKEQDGVTQPWHGNVFLNCPYDDMLRWVDKLIAEFRAGRVPEAICLVNTATDPEWFHKLRNVASALCFTRGRIKFFDAHGNEATGSPPVGQALFYLGSRSDEFARQFSTLGSVVDLTRYRYRDLAAHREEVA